MSVLEKTLSSYSVIQVNAKSVKPEAINNYEGLCFICKKLIEHSFAEISDMLSRKVEKHFCSSKCLKAYISKSVPKKIEAIIHNRWKS
jgi:hypothetical protein